jgi:hypothetical protein
MDAEERKEILLKQLNFSQQEYNEHMICINALPVVNMTVKAEVLGSTTFEVGDVLNVKVKIEFKNFKKDERSGYVHSRTYPYLRRENWYLIGTEQSMTGIAFVEKLHIDSEVFEKNIEEKMHRAGPLSFVILLVNDSYKGLDQIASVDLII